MRIRSVISIVLFASASAIATADAAPPITAAVFTPDGTQVVVGSQAGIEVRSFPELVVERQLKTRLAHVNHLTFSPNGQFLAAAGGTPAESGDVELFNWPDGEATAHDRHHDDLVYCVAWSADGKWRATASADRSVYLINGEDKRFSGHSRAVTSVVFLRDGEHLVSAGLDNSLRVWNVATGELVRTLDNHTAAVRDLAVRPSSGDQLATIASASADRTVRLWQPTIGRLVRFARLPVEPLEIVWTPDGSRLLASCTDGHLRVIDPESVKIVADIPAIDGWAYALAAAPDGRHALVGGEKGQLRVVRMDAASP